MIWLGDLQQNTLRKVGCAGRVAANTTGWRQEKVGLKVIGSNVIVANAPLAADSCLIVRTVKSRRWKIDTCSFKRLRANGNCQHMVACESDWSTVFWLPSATKVLALRFLNIETIVARAPVLSLSKLCTLYHGPVIGWIGQSL